jgi:hypothetical protein
LAAAKEGEDEQEGWTGDELRVLINVNMSQGSVLLALGSPSSGLVVTSLKRGDRSCCKANVVKGGSSGTVLNGCATGRRSFSHFSASCSGSSYSESHTKNYSNENALREDVSLGSNLKNVRSRFVRQRLRYGRVRAVRRRNGRVQALWGLWEQEERDQHTRPEKYVEADDIIEIGGPLTSIGDFTRFRDNGKDGAELQTAIITYRKAFPWNLFKSQQVLLACRRLSSKTSLDKELGHITERWRVFFMYYPNQEYLSKLQLAGPRVGSTLLISLADIEFSTPEFS